MSSLNPDRVLVAIMLFLAAGCPSFTTVGTARTIDRGRVQWVSGVSEMVVRNPVGDPSEPTSTQKVPMVETGVRYGLRDNVELGAKIWPIGLQADVKVALRRSSRDRGLSISVNPALSFEAEPTEHLHSVSAYGTALLGYRIRRHEVLAIGGFIARFGTRTWDGETRHDQVIYGRLAVGVSVSVRDWLRVQPQIGIVYPFNPERSLGVGFAGPAFAASIGFVLGRE
jgi:hypothetical protein